MKLKNYYSRKGYKVESTSANQKSATHVNIYIENSGSMNGYINGNTQFKTAIQDLLVLLKYEFDERINIYFINF